MDLDPIASDAVRGDARPTRERTQPYRTVPGANAVRDALGIVTGSIHGEKDELYNRHCHVDPLPVDLTRNSITVTDYRSFSEF
jgi:hypothetical protein